MISIFPMNSIEQNIPLKDKTSFRIGGPARYYAKVKTESEIEEALSRAREKGEPVFILGRGSNILICDKGWPGLVLDISEYSAISWNGSFALCQSGAPLHTLVKESVDRGLYGIEQLAGIPGSVGGALIMNAGAFKQAVSDCLVSVKGIDCSSYRIWELGKEKIDFGYRTSSFKGKDKVLLEAEFQFWEGDIDDLKSVYHDILQKRSSKQPLDKPNCGSVFKNPEGYYAAALIEKCGLKGHHIGGAMVSEKHANFIVNVSDASASDVRKLIAFIQEKVYREQGILLEPEVVFVGEFEEALFRP